MERSIRHGRTMGGVELRVATSHKCAGNGYGPPVVFALLCVMQDSGTDLMPTDIKYYQEFGGEKVIFEKEEVTEMKKFGEPGIHVCICEGYSQGSICGMS